MNTKSKEKIQGIISRIGSIESASKSGIQFILENNIDCVFYDYIHTSPALLAEFMGARIREDKQKMSFNTFFPLISGVI